MAKDWKMADGKYINYDVMTNKHLKNIILLLERKYVKPAQRIFEEVLFRLYSKECLYCGNKMGAINNGFNYCYLYCDECISRSPMLDNSAMIHMDSDTIEYGVAIKGVEPKGKQFVDSFRAKSEPAEVPAVGPELW